MLNPIPTIIYFDIDGVLLNYDDVPKEALIKGKLENLLKTINFDSLICVSSWVDIIKTAKPRASEEDIKYKIWDILKEIFPDQTWFLDKLEIRFNNDYRANHINLSTNWFFIDDWADEFYQKRFSKEEYEAQLNERILLVDPYSDGNDIIKFLSKLT